MCPYLNNVFFTTELIPIVPPAIIATPVARDNGLIPEMVIDILILDDCLLGLQVELTL